MTIVNTFDFLSENNYIKVLDKDKRKAKELYNHNVVLNVKKYMNTTQDISFKDISDLLTTNKELKHWYAVYKLDYAFYMTTFSTYEGLNLTKEEIQRIRLSHETTSRKRAELAEKTRKLAEEFAAARKKMTDDLVTTFFKGERLAVVNIITSDSLPFPTHVQLNRIADTDERIARTREAVKDLKNEVIGKIKKGEEIDLSKFLL